MNMSQAGKLGYLKTKPIFEKKYQDRLAAYNTNPTKCLCCSTVFEYKHRNKKFCNHSCSAQVNNIGVTRHGSTTFKLVKDKPVKIEKYCLGCGKQVIRTYCSTSCMQNYLWMMRKKSFEKLDRYPNDKTAKRYLLEINFNHNCDLCGNNEWLGKPLLLLLDHIDGNSGNKLKTNFRLICSNCDSTLSTYKNRNKGNGRFLRRQRYKLNKSY